MFVVVFLDVWDQLGGAVRQDARASGPASLRTRHAAKPNCSTATLR